MGFKATSAVVIPLYRHNSDETVFSTDSDEALSLSDMVYEFLEDCDSTPETESRSGNNYDDFGDDEDVFDVEKSKVFWETQENLLQATLCRTSSIESKIRQATKEALNSAAAQCNCRKVIAGGCRDCRRREVSVRLRNAGYDCGLCKSKWRSSPDIPSGEHTYLEAVDRSDPRRGEVRVIIELNFRAEFEMARANDAYNRLTSRLPEVFVGKADRIKPLVKIMCSAAKKCMKEKKMHLGPWRKHKYMQAKWLGTCTERPALELPKGISNVRPARPKASMLTFDLLDSLTTLHCPTAIQVL